MTERTRSIIVSIAVIAVIVLAGLLWLQSLPAAQECIRNLSC